MYIKGNKEQYKYIEEFMHHTNTTQTDLFLWASIDNQKPGFIIVCNAEGKLHYEITRSC